MLLKCSIILLFFFTIEVNLKTIKQLHIIFRHGERTPTETYKNDPYRNITWPGGWGQLTNKGKEQMYFLGIKIKKEFSQFIPPYHYKKITVLSSYSDRCLMSAQALLAGLFPPIGEQIWNNKLLWQPIPVHYTPRSQDTLIAMKAKCKKYDDELASVMKSEKIRQIEKENTKLLEYLTEKTGQNITTIGDVELLYNTLEIELLNNLTLPTWLKNVSMENLKFLAARTLEMYTETDYMKRMKGGVFLKHVLASINENKQVYLYAAHDLTLVNILKTLGYHPVLKPGFGASLSFIIYDNSEILIHYRNDFESDAEVISARNCRNPCSVSDFQLVMHEYLPKNWESECKQNN